MCSSLKYGVDSTSIARIGDPIPIRWGFNSEHTSLHEWSGFAKQEKADYWKREGQAIGWPLPLTSFIEGNMEFRIPGNKRIWGLLLRREVRVHGTIIGKINSVKLLTRAPCSTFEKNVHSRWPVVLDVNTAEVYQFENQDIIRGQQELI